MKKEYWNVLVIDDDRLTTELIREILESDGYNCEICQSVKSLKKCLKQADFSIFIIDLMLNGLEGISLISELRRNYPESIILVITGLSASEHLQSSIQSGADYFFSKPVNAANLLQKLQRLVQRISEPLPVKSVNNLIWRSFQGASNPIFIINKSGDLYFANSAFLQLSGLNSERITRFNLGTLQMKTIDDPVSLIKCCEMGMKETRILESRFNQGKYDETWYNVIIIPLEQAINGDEPLFLFQLFNITRKKQMDNFILNNEEKFRSFISLSNDGMALINEKGQVIEWNGSLTRITGISMERVYGELIWDILSWGRIRIDDKPVEPEVLKKFIFLSLKKGLNIDNAKENMCQITHSDGHIVHLQYSLFTIRVDNGYRLGMVIRDNTASVNDRIYIAEQHEKLNQAYQEMEKLARIDPLTQISNRRDVEIRLDYEMTRYERHHNPFSLSIVDIDDFKKFNDTYGHDMGDFVLVEIAKLMKETIRAQDILGRWGGEEFILVFPETNAGGGDIIAERIRSQIEKHNFKFKNVEVSVSITGGLAEYHPGEELNKTVKRADEALYKGKNSGKNCIVISN
ncbi:MAG: diguanylate cyclase [Candidatus Cloacimonetes bacterium]|nr:diguanylate cyclase [Candidatus Cloacimonadota bacterium]